MPHTSVRYHHQWGSRGSAFHDVGIIMTAWPCNPVLSEHGRLTDGGCGIRRDHEACVLDRSTEQTKAVITGWLQAFGMNKTQSRFPQLASVTSMHAAHYEIQKDYQSTSKVHAQVVQNLIVLPREAGFWQTRSAGRLENPSSSGQEPLHPANRGPQMDATLFTCCEE